MFLHSGRNTELSEHYIYIYIYIYISLFYNMAVFFFAVTKHNIHQLRSHSKTKECCFMFIRSVPLTKAVAELHRYVENEAFC